MSLIGLVQKLATIFLKSFDSDGEIPTDHAISAILYDIASKYDIRYIISEIIL